MRTTRTLRWAAGVAAVAMLATACGGGEGGEGTETDEGGGGAGGDLTVFATEGSYLVPGAADDDPAIQVIRQLYRGLTKYNPESGETEMDIAESMESDDNVTWTVTLKEGYEFTNGEPVDADSFIRSWNYTANINNNQANAYFMGKIAGIDELQSEDVGPDATLSGVEKVDDYTFTVELNEPFSGFPAVVGYSGFFPVAEACLEDFDACNEEPIANGPYMMDGPWQHNQEIRLVKNPNYGGEDEGNVDSITYRIFDEIAAGYTALQAGELDLMYTVPPEELARVEDEFGERLFQTPSDSFTYLGIPLYQEEFQDPNLRKAFSMAIDRQAIIDALFDGASTPAAGFVSPNFEGYRDDACDACQYDPEQAQQLFDEAGGYDGTLHLWANGGSGHETWLQAIGDQLQQNLGIEYQLHVGISDFAQYLEKADGHDFNGPFRLGWGPDYPVLETYLGPLYSEGGSSNTSGYQNPDFDAKVAEGNAADDIEQAIEHYQEAEDMLAEDMPSIPLWFADTTVVWNDTVEEMQFNSIWGRPNYGQTVMANN